MEGAGRALANCSQLTCLVDLFNAAMAGSSVFSPAFDCGVLAGVTAVFFVIAKIIQKRNLMKGL